MAEKWEELSGKNNWHGLLNPLDVDLRKYIIQYGEKAEVTYDTFISDKASKYMELADTRWKIFSLKVGLDPTKYRVTKFFYATSSMPLPDAFITKSLSREAWKSARSKFNKTSARDQVLEEVKRLIEEYKHEEVSITVTGHSLGASLATMNAVDIAFNGINKSSNGKEFPVTAFVFASPKVGDLSFVNAFNKLKHLHILRIHNLLDIVPKYPPLGYFDVGQEIMTHRKIPLFEAPRRYPHFLHNLECYLHGVAGTQGLIGFKLEVDHAISRFVNKSSGALKDEYLVPANWWTVKNKGMIQQEEDGKMVLNDREDYDIIVAELL
ncbi:hypothetical protein HAX54_012422 [Datura stramonium]|uniref:Phospholipase A1 n=1 Tax=Datura stramonium TaxID=4076 RepID=A0ABS8TJR0_DATST|nr:hypothetical protein [Datura stramonium]